MNALSRLLGLEGSCGLESFENKLKQTGNYPLRAGGIGIFQMNVGKRCNLSCRHCHVEAGPERPESMSKRVFEQCLRVINGTPSITTVDLTGGAPEMNPNLEWFITEASKIPRRLIVRSNLAILADSRYAGYIDVYAKNNVELCVSLPDYRGDRTGRQRGRDVYQKVIAVIKTLNEKGYGWAGGPVLDLVHNPSGAYLPGRQKSLEGEYRAYLKKEHGIIFNDLFCITNMPIGRYFDYLLESDNICDYMKDLENTFNPAAVSKLMCRTMISVSWDGRLYDCDFNQMLGLTVSDKKHASVGNFDISALNGRDIVVRNHCYGCTAGSGSSCQGSIE